MTAIRFELKAGTSTSVATPGSAVFDNFHAGLSVAPPSLQVVTSALAAGQLRQPYQATLSSVGGMGATTWSLAGGALPSGLTLSADGVISGTPTAVGTSTFVVMATDSMWSGYPASQTLTIAITDEVMLADTFDALDHTKWPGGTFTSAADTSVPVAASGGALQIGPMPASVTGSHYNGVNSAAYDFTSNGAASVQLAQAGNGLAYAMFAAGSDANNFYRWYVSGGQIVVERKINGTKKTLRIVSYDAAAHQFLRVRTEIDVTSGMPDVVFETAPGASGAPGTFSEFYREAWDSHVVVSAMKFELKGGTSDAIASPGSVRFDNFTATRR
jgi:hypothetical protein